MTQISNFSVVSLLLPVHCLAPVTEMTQNVWQVMNAK